MSTLVENEGLVSLYRGENDSVIVEINGRKVTLQQPFKFAYNIFWSPVAADLFNDPNSDNDNNILTFWNNIQVESDQFGDYRWQVASFSSENGKFVGMYDVGGTFLPGDKFLEQPLETLYLEHEDAHTRLVGLYGDIYNKSTEALSSLTDLQALNYIASNEDLINAFGTDIYSAKYHYTNHGKSEGRSLNIFSAKDYLAKYSDLSAFNNYDNLYYSDEYQALNHFIQYGYKEGRTDSDSDSFSEGTSNLTDIEGLNYIASYVDLINAFGTDIEAAKSHFNSYGISEGRSLDSFDEWQYLASNEDLISAFGSDTTAAIEHYLLNGYAEGRSKDSFDEWGYLASNNDLMNAFGSNTTEAIKHYISHGLSEGRVTNSFNVDSYLNNYADINSAFGHDHNLAKKHFVEHGFAEGRVF